MADEPDWADGYDPTDPESVPKNMTKSDYEESGPITSKVPSKQPMPPGIQAAGLLTTQGPLNWYPAPPQEDPSPYESNQLSRDAGILNLGGPDVEVKRNEGPFFSEMGPDRRFESSRELPGKYLLSEIERLGVIAPNSPYSLLRKLDSMGASPSTRLFEDPVARSMYMPEATQLGKDAGTGEIDKYNSRFIMPDTRRDRQMYGALDDADYQGMKNRLPDYLRRKYDDLMAQQKESRDPAEKLYADALDETGNVRWEGDKAPTQKDVDVINAQPSDKVLEQFEEQFGKGSVGKYADWAKKDDGQNVGENNGK